MTVHYAHSLTDLEKAAQQSAPLAVMPRDQSGPIGDLVDDIMAKPFRAVGRVRQSDAITDIHRLLDDELAPLTAHPAYQDWVLDMAEICKTFASIIGSDAVGFCLGTERGCRRYHIDNVPIRLLVTYGGRGTEWIPDHAADRDAFLKGAPNEEIVKDREARQFIPLNHIALFRGGPQGILHRTPDAALGGASLQLRLDAANFWDNITLVDGQNRSAA